jgi:hypothetical protein
MISPGATLRELRERKPLVHQITNYVVMNETANATLALGALPVMAHAREEVEEMVGLASALVLNIGTLSDQWIEAMLLAGSAASARGIPVVLDPVGAGATAYRTDTARRILGEVRVTVLRGNPGEVRRSSAPTRRCEASSRSRLASSLRSSRARPAGSLGSSRPSPARSTTSPMAGGRSPWRTAIHCSLQYRHRLHLVGADRLLPRCEARRAARGCGGGARRARCRRRGRRLTARPAPALPRAALRRARGARPGDARRPGAHNRVVTTLGDVGEFGLLAELERRGLAEGIEHDAAVVDGLVVTQDALVEESTSASTS